MFAFSQSRDKDQPPSTVWEYLIALEQVPLWEYGVNEVRQLAPGDPVVGTPISARRVYAGRETHLTGEVVKIEPGRSATLALRGGPHVESLEASDPAQIDGSWGMVSANVAPRARAAPGFVSALWMSDRAGRTLNVLVFRSEEAARAALEAARTAPRPPFMHVESVDLFTVLASA